MVIPHVFNPEPYKAILNWSIVPDVPRALHNILRNWEPDVRSLPGGDRRSSAAGDAYLGRQRPCRGAFIGGQIAAGTATS